MSTNNYQFNRARKLNRSARAESKQELSYANFVRGREDGSGGGGGNGGMHCSNQWQSIAALGGEDNFSRLKKSYATLRKSFRLQLSSDHEREFDFTFQCDSEPARTNGLMGQLGSGAAKLLRGVYAKGQRAYYNGNSSANHNNNHEPLDSIRFTDGSFKVLSPTKHYDDDDDNDGRDDSSCNRGGSGGQIVAAAPVSRKSLADLEIEQRLRRSRRRVLPSAQYQAPASDKACEGLNMEELEEIKRDNLRMTMLKTTTTQGKQLVLAPVAGATATTTQPLGNQENSFKKLDRLQTTSHEVDVEQLVCSCRDIDCAEKSPMQHLDLGTTTTVSSSPPTPLPIIQQHQQQESHYCTCASISSSFSSLDQLIEFGSEEQNHDGPLQLPFRAASLRARDSESRASGEASISSSSSSSSFVGDKIEDRLKAMFDSMENKLQFLSNENERNFELGNDCGGVNLANQTASICVRLSSKAGQKKQQPHDTKIRNLLQQQEQLQRSENITKARDLTKQQQQQATVNERREPEDSLNLSSSACELAASLSLGGANLQSGQLEDSGQQQVSGSSVGGCANSSSNSGYCDGGIETTGGNSSSSSGGCSSNNSNETSVYPSYSPQPLLKGYDDAIELAASKQQQLVCANTSGHQCSDVLKLNAKQKHFMKEQRNQNQTPDHHHVCQSNKEIHGVAENHAVQTKDHHHQHHQRRSTPRARQQEVMLNRMCARRTGKREQQHMTTASNQMGPKAEYPESITTTIPVELYGDEHLYASISDTPSATSPDQRRRGPQRQFQQEVDKNNEIAFHQFEYQQSNRDRLSIHGRLADHHHEELYVRQSEQSRLFDKQLKNEPHVVASDQLQQQFPNQTPYHGHENSSIPQQIKQKTKKSLLGRLKDMIVPTGCRTNKAAIVTKCQWPSMMQGNNVDQLSGGGTLKLDRRSELASRWQKSATLTTRSTQNLIGGKPFRYGSNGKKSINMTDEYYGDSSGPVRPLTSAGFLTLGRRGNHYQQQHNAELLNKYHQLAVDQVFEDRNAADRSRFAGSADSLPSADSGLSCSNLQNSGSSDDYYAVANNLNITSTSHKSYSRGPKTPGRTLTNDWGQERNRVIGKARAMVDCNPCAYDKEALVFKRGDIIDILERNQTGTWVGNCNGQTGHFKFINVTELSLDEDVDVSDLHRCGRKDERNNGGVFVTKLEIRSNNSDQIKLKSGQEPVSSGGSLATINRRSKSMNTISQQQTASVSTSSRQEGGGRTSSSTTTTTTAGQLSGSNETIMNSLEQLLFAIGLAGEQINRKRQLNHDTGDDDELVGSKLATKGDEISINGSSKRHEMKWSYLDVLNRGGINNLDSFSAIDDWHELEQIGIVDDEHQRRLLMAARIIRQASQAAKLDFVENYLTKSEGGVQGEVIDYVGQITPPAIEKGASAHKETVSPDARNRRISGITPTTTPATKLSKCSKKGDRHNANSANEPIYVNLIRGRGFLGSNESIVSSGSSSGGGYRAGKVPEGGDTLVKKLDQKQHKLAEGSNLIHRPELLQRDRDHHHHNQAELAGSQHPLDGGEMKMNSINQSDHYRPHCRYAQNSTQDTSQAESDGYYDDDNDNDYYDDNDDDVDSREENFGHGLNKSDNNNNNMLNRGYSMRVSSRNGNGCSILEKCNQFNNLNQRTAEGNGVQTSSGAMIDRIELSSLSPRHSLIVNSSKLHCSPLQAPQRRRIVLGDRPKFEARKLNCDWPVTRQPSKDLKRPTIQNEHQRNDTASNLGSQINSRSAYDLRLDLSHFFS